VTADLIYLESLTSEFFITIDESGDRDIVVDESSDRQISIIEGVV